MSWKCGRFLSPARCVRCTAVAFGSIVLLACSSSRATIIVNDSWDSGLRTNPPAVLTSPYSTTYSENGTNQDSFPDLSSAWFNAGTGSSMVATTNNLTTTAGSGSSQSAYTYFTAPGTAVVLANPGDQMILTWVFTPTGVAAQNTSQGFNVAVVDTPSSVARPTGDASVPSGQYAGYSIFGNMGTTLGASNSFALKEWTLAGAGALLGTSGNWGANGTSGGTLVNGSGATTGAAGYNSATQYTMTWTFTRGSSNDLKIEVTMAGSGLIGTGLIDTGVFDDPSPNSFTFDTFDFRPSTPATTATSFDTTLFEVQGPLATVPEPASMVLFGLGAAALSMVQLRRRQNAANGK
jgi:hypothetical protein